MCVSSVYSPFSERVGLPPHNVPSSGVLMKSIGAEFFLRPDALPGVNHMCGMQYQIVLNKTLWCTNTTQNSNINLRSKPPFSRLVLTTYLGKGSDVFLLLHHKVDNLIRICILWFRFFKLYGQLCHIKLYYKLTAQYGINTKNMFLFYTNKMLVLC